VSCRKAGKLIPRAFINLSPHLFPCIGLSFLPVALQRWWQKRDFKSVQRQKGLGAAQNLDTANNPKNGCQVLNGTPYLSERYCRIA
jgi:hypothetical protein